MERQGARATTRPVVFDTDVLIWYFRGHAKARRFLGGIARERRAVSSLAVMELIQGCRTRDEIEQVTTFLAENVPLLLHPDEHVSRRAIDLLKQHALAHGLRVVDALIAATALEASAALASANLKHYRPVARLRLIRFRP
jgi:hypothetical protein